MGGQAYFHRVTLASPIAAAQCEIKLVVQQNNLPITCSGVLGLTVKKSELILNSQMSAFYIYDTNFQ